MTDQHRKERISMAKEICSYRGENPGSVDRNGQEGWEKYEPLAGAVIREAERLSALRATAAVPVAGRAEPVAWRYRIKGQSIWDLRVDQPRKELNDDLFELEPLYAALSLPTQPASGCICQDQHRRGYCTEPGCSYAQPVRGEVYLVATPQTAEELDAILNSEETNPCTVLSDGSVVREDCQCPTCGRMHRHLGNPPASIRASSIVDATQPAREEVRQTISLSDPRIIIAGIRRFGLAPDGSDLRDLEAALAAPSLPTQPANGPITTEQLDKLQFGRDLHQQPAREEVREALDLLCLIWEGRARWFRILNKYGERPHEPTEWKAEAYEECANELRAALAQSPKAQT